MAKKKTEKKASKAKVVRQSKKNTKTKTYKATNASAGKKAPPKGTNSTGPRKK